MYATQNGGPVLNPSKVTLREESSTDYEDIDRVNRMAFAGADEADVVRC